MLIHPIWMRIYVESLSFKFLLCTEKHTDIFCSTILGGRRVTNILFPFVFLLILSKMSYIAWYSLCYGNGKRNRLQWYMASFISFDKKRMLPFPFGWSDAGKPSHPYMEWMLSGCQWNWIMRLTNASGLVYCIKLHFKF